MENEPITKFQAEENLKLAEEEKIIAKISTKIYLLELKKAKYQEDIMKLEYELVDLKENMAKKLIDLISHNKEAKNKGLTTYLEEELQIGLISAEKLSKKAKVKRIIADLKKKIADEDEKILSDRVKISKEKLDAAQIRSDLGKTQLIYINIAPEPANEEKKRNVVNICITMEKTLIKAKHEIIQKEVDIVKREGKITAMKKVLAEKYTELHTL
jgi:hypothetical protein